MSIKTLFLPCCDERLNFCRNRYLDLFGHKQYDNSHIFFPQPGSVAAIVDDIRWGWAAIRFIIAEKQPESIVLGTHFDCRAYQNIIPVEIQNDPEHYERFMMERMIQAIRAIKLSFPQIEVFPVYFSVINFAWQPNAFTATQIGI